MRLFPLMEIPRFSLLRQKSLWAFVKLSIDFIDWVYDESEKITKQLAIIIGCSLHPTI